MTIATPQPISAEERRQLEELYRAQISAVRALARLLGYPCPIADRRERSADRMQSIDVRGTLTLDS